MTTDDTTDDPIRPPDHRNGHATPQDAGVTRRRAIQLTGGAAVATAAATLLSSAGPPSGTRGGDLPSLRLAGGATQLLIPEPSPEWWNTPNIWVVPGSDPTRPPGMPTAGDPAYVWARIYNVGDLPVTDVQVRFYWANPAFEMRYSTINLIGTAHASIAAGQSQDVLCLVSWQVEFVNGGHECLVVAASLPGDPPLPDLVDPPGYPQVAQKNVTVWQVAPDRLAWLKLDLTAPRDQSRTILVSSQLGGSAAPALLAQLQLAGAQPVDEPAVQVGFSLQPPGDQVGDPELVVDVPAGQTVPVYLGAHRTGPIPSGRYQLVTASGHQDQQLLGGVTLLVTGSE